MIPPVFLRSPLPRASSFPVRAARRPVGFCPADPGTLCNNAAVTGVIAVVLAALCFATTGTAQALADVDASPLSVGAARILIGGGILGAIALVTRPLMPRAAPSAEAAVARRAPTWVIVTVGAIGVLAYQPTFFAGTRLNGVAVGTVIALGSAPIVTGILDALIRRRMPSLRWGVATAIALVGVVLVSGLVGGAGAAGVGPLGVLASLAAGASYALYALASKLLMDRGWSFQAAMGAVFGVAAVVSLPLLLATSPGWLFTPAGLALALWLGVVTTAVAYLLFGWGLRRLAPTTVATLTLAEPLGATLLGVWVLHEHLTVASAIGLVVLALGLVVLSLPTARKEKTDVSAPA
ncbi:MAG: EamA family transporter [Actinobacteria bacterium]|nr:MAG: EamA family transporter [Actinomycetota bacterium]HIE62483.1 EamA family transporter [Microbacterium sp.]